MNILVTGANGFIGRNLIFQLRENKEFKIFSYVRESTKEELSQWISQADFIFHLAGVNRPKEPSEFKEVNADLTESVCDLLKEKVKRPLFFFHLQFKRHWITHMERVN